MYARFDDVKYTLKVETEIVSLAIATIESALFIVSTL